MLQAPTMDQTQRRMMLLLPLFFVIFIIGFPAGLILYWITTNAWTMTQQWAIRRRIDLVLPVTPAASTAPSGRGDGRRAPTTNGDGSGAGLSALLRGRAKPQEKQLAAVGTSTRTRR